MNGFLEAALIHNKSLLHIWTPTDPGPAIRGLKYKFQK